MLHVCACIYRTFNLSPVFLDWYLSQEEGKSPVTGQPLSEDDLLSVSSSQVSEISCIILRISFVQSQLSSSATYCFSSSLLPDASNVFELLLPWQARETFLGEAKGLLASSNRHDFEEEIV